VRSPSAIGIDNDLATGQTGVTLWATDNEPSRWLDLSEIG
jgi:hypothetical protein